MIESLILEAQMIILAIIFVFIQLMGNQNSQKIQQQGQRQAPTSPKKLKHSNSKSPRKSPSKQLPVEQKPSNIIPPVISNRTNQQNANNISPELWRNIEPIMRVCLDNFRFIFVGKIIKNQIRLIFQAQSLQFQNSSKISHYSQHSLAFLFKRSSNDLKIYEQIRNARIKAFFSQQNPKNTIDVINNLEKITQILQLKLNQLNLELIGQIQGKTSIWHSLNLSQEAKINNIIAFLDKEGIEYSAIDFLKAKRQRIGSTL